MIQRLRTKGHERALQQAGLVTCVPLHHPQNRKELREQYAALPRPLRRAIFGKWRRTRNGLRPEWVVAEHARQAALQKEAVT